MRDYRKILYSVDQGIARLTLNRPEKRNALDEELIEEFRDALRISADDAAVRVILLTGAGKDFCSGMDLATLERVSQAGVMENLAHAQRLGDLFIEMRHHPRPIIAAVRGRALAGGCGIATSADVILAAESAQFGYPEIKIGFVPAMVMSILRRSVSERRAFELLATGDAISAREAVEIGMANRFYADDRFEGEVESYVNQMASRSASALSLTKRLLYDTDSLSFEAGISAGVQANALARMTEDCRRGVEQFLKKK